MFSPSVGNQLTESGSALRYGLLDIKPIEVNETINRFGLKIRRTARTFIYERPKTFEDYISFTNNAIFEKIDIPERFDINELIKLYSERSIKNHENDIELKQTIEKIKKSKTIKRPLVSFIQFMKNRFESRKDKYLEFEAKRFLNSNFSLSLSSKFVIFDNTFYDYLKLLEKIVRWYELRASVARDFRMYKRNISEMKLRISPIIDDMDSCFFYYICLKRYITIWNSKDYQEIIDGPEFLDINKIDRNKFEKLFVDFEGELGWMRESIYNSEPSLLEKELNVDVNTKRMFSKLLMVPSFSLRNKS